jgi:C4-dicarboxylate transporter DctM subunit
MMTLYGIPVLVTDWILHLQLSPLNIILLLNLVILIMGCFLEVTSLMVMIVPIVYPIVTALGFDGVWFGIVLMVNFNMAVETPPVGLNLYVLKGIDKELPMSEIIMGVFPFYLCETMGLVLVTLFPAISLWLVWMLPG